MKPTRYKVRFMTGLSEVVFAFSGREAAILAQAAQIQKGNLYEVLSVTNIATEPDVAADPRPGITCKTQGACRICGNVACFFNQAEHTGG